MKTGIVSSKNVKDVKKLWTYCFADTPEFIEYYFTKRYRQEKNIITEDDQENMQASLQLHPYTLVVDEICKDVNYIVGVCVEPESRGKGYSSAIMKDTLNFEYMNGEDVSILMPIDTDIYTRYGYTNCFYRYEFNVDLANIKAERSKCTTKRINLDSILTANYENGHAKNDLLKTVTQMSNFYHKNILDKYAYIKRDQDYFINKLEELAIDGGELFVTYEGSQLCGYMMILPRYSKDQAAVTEMIFSNKDSFNAMMSIIKSHITQFRIVDIVTPQHELFNLFIKYDNKYKVIKKSFMMLRVINAKSILCEMINRKSGLNQMRPFQIEIRDDIIKENNFKENYFVNEEAEVHIPYMNIDISDLAALYMKSSNVTDLERAGRIVFKNDYDRAFFVELLGQDIRENYINDFI